MNSNLVFKILDNSSQDYGRAILLAEEILRLPLGLKFSALELAEEKNKIRVAGFLDDDLCATAMITQDDNKFFMQRVAVKKEMQNKGIGSQLLKFCEELAQKNGMKAIYAHARESKGRSVVNFYTKNSYSCGDEEFFEDGIANKIVWKVFA